LFSGKNPAVESGTAAGFQNRKQNEKMSTEIRSREDLFSAIWEERTVEWDRNSSLFSRVVIPTDFSVLSGGSVSRASGNPDPGLSGFYSHFRSIFSLFVAPVPLGPRVRGDDEQDVPNSLSGKRTCPSAEKTRDLDNVKFLEEWVREKESLGTGTRRTA
jgi:hypothetical protein